MHVWHVHVINWEAEKRHDASIHSIPLPFIPLTVFTAHRPLPHRYSAHVSLLLLKPNQPNQTNVHLSLTPITLLAPADHLCLCFSPTHPSFPALLTFLSGIVPCLPLPPVHCPLHTHTHTKSIPTKDSKTRRTATDVIREPVGGPLVHPWRQRPLWALWQSRHKRNNVFHA